MQILKVVALFLLLSFANVAFGAEGAEIKTSVDPEKVQVINELLETTGALNVANQVMGKMIQAEKEAHPEVDAVIWERMAHKLDANDLQGSLIEIYDRHFSTADLRAVLTFYKSEPGQRMLKELPSVMSEAMIVGQEWGRKKALELKAELQSEQANQTKHG